MLSYPIGSSGQSICFAPEVLAHFHRHRQTRWYHREAGGQLFATTAGLVLTIVEATGPRRSDRRTRVSYVPNRAAEASEIADQQTRGRVFVGDWHTHPESVPNPSPLDQRSIQECFRKSTHGLNGFLLVIVGLAEFPDGLLVSVSDSERTHVLHPYS
ncbi:Mov34/MPN/PAD-1 family protein [Caulifigura coniformis]|uniref:Mov34/MPN/PAD-1 family protein n=1 Tax=Caulifigura coniformis TaxID=2527983 RepID=UPI0011A459BC